MSESIKDALVKSGIITSIIAILLIVFGNTGTGFFSNLMIFIIGTLIGTPIAIVGKFIGTLFKGFHEAFEYIGLILGALIGVSLAVSLFSNKVETSFMYNCVHHDRGTKIQCECVYSEISDKYDNDVIKVMLQNPSKDYGTDYLNYYKQCK